MGAALIVLGGAFLLTRKVIDKVSATLIILAGIYAILWKEPVLLGFEEGMFVSLEAAKVSFFLLLSGAVFLWAYWIFEQHVELLEATRDQLKDALARGQTYLDILSHDIRNPLTIADHQLELHLMKHPDEHGDLAGVQRNLDRVEEVIQQSLLYARLEEDMGDPHAPVDLTELMEERARGLLPLAERKSVALAMELPDPGEVRITPILGHVIENLLANAIEWSPEGGQVDVTVEQDHAAGCWRLRVSDHGPGLRPGEAARIFDRFRRGEAPKTDRAGAGLGLAIARRIVEMHDGRIWVEDTPGGGATFGCELPLLENRPARDPAPPSTPGVPAEHAAAGGGS